MSSKPSRSHSYEFAHVALRQRFFAASTQVADILAVQRDGRAWLEWFWRRRVGDNLPPEVRQRPIGFALDSRTVDDYRLFLVTPPEPEFPPEPDLIGLVVDPKTTGQRTARYFTRELTLVDDPEEGGTVFAEWTDEGYHLQHGRGIESALEAFIDAIRRELNGKRPDRLIEGE